jgi:glycosyltransferase involved in cell wall biosynthesis
LLQSFNSSTRKIIRRRLSRSDVVIEEANTPGQFSPPSSRPENTVPLIVFVAQLAERKGAPFLVEACKLLAERGVAFQCVIAGDGPERQIVEGLVEQYNLKESVTLTGAIFQEQVQEYLYRADIFAMPCITARNGDMDGVPVALMEAMACEITTVSTRVSGIPELIQDGESGLLSRKRCHGIGRCFATID